MILSNEKTIQAIRDIFMLFTIDELRTLEDIVKTVIREKTLLDCPDCGRKDKVRSEASRFWCERCYLGFGRD